jgi:hypothetical protein
MIPTLTLGIIGPCRRRADQEKTAHRQGGGPCFASQTAKHDVTDKIERVFILIRRS